ncbi:MAG TPA: hypothetical protein VMW54_13235 [Terriglobia bacterium]|nr:hypothetical protein [Terriglobia bacterium]
MLGGVSRLRRLASSDRFFFIPCGVLHRRKNLSEGEFAGLSKRTEDWPWSSAREYSGSVHEKATRHPVLPIDRVLLPSDEQTRI